MLIRQCDFIVHPGYLSDPHVASDLSHLSHVPAIASVIDQFRIRTEKLFDTYQQRLLSLSSDHMVLVFLYEHRDQFFENEQEGRGRQISFVKQLCKDFGSRALVISDDEICITDPDKLRRTVNQCMEKNGLSMKENLKSFAYGEMIGACVDQIADCANQSLQLSTKTIILPECCGVDLCMMPSASEIPELAVEQEEVYAHIHYSR